MKNPRIRITGGELGGRFLAGPSGVPLRPTTSAARQMMFNMLGASVKGASFLDLFAGTGAVGFEALSRGASRAVFVEIEPAAAESIRRNGEGLGLLQRIDVVCCDAARAPDIIPWPARHHVIFADPPYELYPAPGIAAWENGVAGDGLLVYEHSARRPPPVVKGLGLIESRRNGEALFSFYRKEGTDA